MLRRIRRTWLPLIVSILPMSACTSLTHLILAVEYVMLVIALLQRGRKISVRLWWSRGTSPLGVWHDYWPLTGYHLLGPSLLLLRSLRSSASGFVQRVLNRSYCFNREYRPLVQRSRYRLFPCIQHLLQLPPYVVIEQGICIHKNAVEVSA